MQRHLLRLRRNAHHNQCHQIVGQQRFFSTLITQQQQQQKKDEKPWLNGPGLQDFIQKHSHHHHHHHHHHEDDSINLPSSVDHYLDQHHKQQQQQQQQQQENITANGEQQSPLNMNDKSNSMTKKVFIETYGCQMNVSDTEIIFSVMGKAGYERCDVLEDADVIFLNTCAIRDNAEQKVWRRLEYIRDLKSLGRFHNNNNHNHKNNNNIVHSNNSNHNVLSGMMEKKKQPLVGVLGCMAERLKTKLLEKEKLVDVVAGPDAYRDLPRLLHVVDHEEQQHAVNVLLSADETYADIAPMRTSDTGVSAFVTIMRGCDNMCSYCIVPFTRGRERSRPIESILDEVRQLSERGFKEVTLLGQNVNSYCDQQTTEQQQEQQKQQEREEQEEQNKRNEMFSKSAGLSSDGTTVLSNEGFKTIYKPKKGGIRFAELVDRVSQIDPEMRIRFTSPHPKDFPDDLLQLIRDRPNVCKQIHMPAQSGSTEVLDRMRRGYSREAYLKLVDHIRATIPGVALSSDFISGFCGETEEQHQDTLSLLDRVQFEHGFLFAYSLREKTHAHRKYTDDVPEDVKKRRLAEAIEVFRRRMLQKLEAQIGTTQLVLVDGTSRRSSEEWVGRTDTNFKVLFKKGDLPFVQADVADAPSPVNVGDYVQVKITSVSGATLRAEPVCKTTLQSFVKRHPTVHA